MQQQYVAETMMCLTTVKFLPFTFFFCDYNFLSHAGCFILTTQLLMAYVLPS